VRGRSTTEATIPAPEGLASVTTAPDNAGLGRQDSVNSRWPSSHSASILIQDREALGQRSTFLTSSAESCDGYNVRSVQLVELEAVLWLVQKNNLLFVCHIHATHSSSCSVHFVIGQETPSLQYKPMMLQHFPHKWWGSYLSIEFPRNSIQIDYR
jgi:hypothetical protein